MRRAEVPAPTCKVAAEHLESGVYSARSLPRPDRLFKLGRKDRVSVSHGNIRCNLTLIA